MAIVSGVPGQTPPREDGGSHSSVMRIVKRRKHWSDKIMAYNPVWTRPDSDRRTGEADGPSHKLEKLRDISDKDIVLLMDTEPRLSLSKCTPAARRAAELHARSASL